MALIRSHRLVSNASRTYNLIGIDPYLVNKIYILRQRQDCVKSCQLRVYFLISLGISRQEISPQFHHGVQNVASFFMFFVTYCPVWLKPWTSMAVTITVIHSTRENCGGILVNVPTLVGLGLHFRWPSGLSVCRRIGRSLV